MNQVHLFLPNICSQLVFLPWSNGFWNLNVCISITDWFLLSKYVCMMNRPPVARVKDIEKQNITVNGIDDWMRVSHCDRFSVSWMSNSNVRNTYSEAVAVYSKKFQKNLWFFNPTQFPTHGQWWSILITQVLHILQWCALGGLTDLQWEQ